LFYNKLGPWPFIAAVSTDRSYVLMVVDCGAKDEMNHTEAVNAIHFLTDSSLDG